jgi:hypothetical protein
MQDPGVLNAYPTPLKCVLSHDVRKLVVPPIHRLVHHVNNVVHTQSRVVRPPVVREVAAFHLRNDRHYYGIQLQHEQERLQQRRLETLFVMAMCPRCGAA